MNTSDISTPKEILNQFVNSIKMLTNSRNCLQLNISTFSLFSTEDSNIRTVSHFGEASKISDETKFDLILGDLPLGMNRIDFEFNNRRLKIRKNWAEILSVLNLLDHKGHAIFLVEPTAFGNAEGAKVESLLNSAGYFVNAIINAPQGLLASYTTITPVFIVITQKRSDYLFVAELLNKVQSKQVANNYFNATLGSDLKQGMGIPPRSFRGFHQIKIKQQIEKLETQYKEYREYTLGELALEINYVRSGGKLTEKENSVYIPKIWKSPVVSSLSDAKSKHHNYFQVVLGEKAINEYVAAFFRSDLGKLILESLTSGSVIPHLNKKELEQAPIALPEIEEQEKILSTQKKLLTLKSAIDNFENEIALNPTSSKHILIQLDSMLDAINSLTEADKIRNLVRQGESREIEFKETFSLDVKKKTKEKYIELSSLKTIVAFLNTEGGTLLIGVKDDGGIVGIDNEIKQLYKNTDKFLLNFKNKIKTHIGEEFYPFIDYKTVIVDNVNILMVKCQKSQTPCYLDRSEFYVRTNPATDKLEGPKLVEYVKNHFGL